MGRAPQARVQTTGLNTDVLYPTPIAMTPGVQQTPFQYYPAVFTPNLVDTIFNNPETVDGLAALAQMAATALASRNEKPSSVASAPSLPTFVAPTRMISDNTETSSTSANPPPPQTVETAAAPMTPAAKPAVYNPAEPINPQCVAHVPAPGEQGFGRSSGVIFSDAGAACNAFRIPGKDLVMTNNHCTEDNSRGTFYVTFRNDKGKNVKFKCRGILAQRKKDDMDYSVIRCPGLGETVPPVKLAEEPPKVGEKITLVTHNFNSRGGFARKVNTGKITRRYAGERYLPSATVISTNFSRGGNSGSSMFNSQGESIGILWGGPDDGYGNASQRTYLTSMSKILDDVNRRFPKVAQEIKNGSAAVGVAACQPHSPSDGLVAMAPPSPDRSPTTMQVASHEKNGLR